MKNKIGTIRLPRWIKLTKNQALRLNCDVLCSVLLILYLGWYELVYFLFSRIGIPDEGAIYILFAAATGAPLLWFLSRRYLHIPAFSEKRRKMSRRRLGLLLCLVLAAQLPYTIWATLIELSLEAFGYTAMTQLEEASAPSGAVSMFIYSAVIAPVAEEIIYRGFVLHYMERYGRFYAIVFSALLFALMHGNLFQFCFAFLMGLVLGYTAAEYSIYWSIALHIFNNFFRGELMTLALSPLPYSVQDYTGRFVNIIFFALCAYLLITHRDQLITYYRVHRPSKNIFRMSLTAIMVLGFAGYFILRAVLRIAPLE